LYLVKIWRCCWRNCCCWHYCCSCWFCSCWYYGCSGWFCRWSTCWVIKLHQIKSHPHPQMVFISTQTKKRSRNSYFRDLFFFINHLHQSRKIVIRKVYLRSSTIFSYFNNPFWTINSVLYFLLVTHHFRPLPQKKTFLVVLNLHKNTSLKPTAALLPLIRSPCVTHKHYS
jgi:hypothetical protein